MGLSIVNVCTANNLKTAIKHKYIYCVTINYQQRAIIVCYGDL
jgi:hypothetical protein